MNSRISAQRNYLYTDKTKNILHYFPDVVLRIIKEGKLRLIQQLIPQFVEFSLFLRKFNHLRNSNFIYHLL